MFWDLIYLLVIFLLLSGLVEAKEDIDKFWIYYLMTASTIAFIMYWNWPVEKLVQKKKT